MTVRYITIESHYDRRAKAWLWLADKIAPFLNYWRWNKYSFYWSIMSASYTWGQIQIERRYFRGAS